MKIWEPIVAAARASSDEEIAKLEAEKSRASEAIAKNKRGSAINIAPLGRDFIGRQRDFHSLWGSIFTLTKTGIRLQPSAARTAQANGGIVFHSEKSHLRVKQEREYEFAKLLLMKTILIDAIDTFVVENGGNFKIFEEMHDLLETFPNRKIILTGANDEQLKEFGLDKMPYEVFTLRHNPEKTDPKYYEMVLDHFDLSKDEVIYFEHNPEAVRIAQAIGIKSYYYDPDKKDLEDLKRFLTENLT